MGSKTKIEYCDATINPYIGCKHGCPYCYAKRMNDRFHFVKKWDEPEEQEGWQYKIPKKPAIIFMGSMTDLFGEWVDNGFIEDMLQDCESFPFHKFLFLTKNPKRYPYFNFPQNCWKGATVADGHYYAASESDCDFISIEPFIPSNFKMLVAWDSLKWVIIGGMTPKNQHEKKHVDKLINFYKSKPIFLKSNLHYPKVIQEFPAELVGGGG